MRTDLFPPDAVRLHVDGLVLRLPDEEQLGQLADLAARGVHEDGAMPFTQPWTVGTPAERARRTWQWSLRSRAEWQQDRWSFDAVVLRDGEVLGTQALTATHLGVLRQVGTGSWLGREHQGRGVGSRMRAAVLAFAFGELRAEHAVTEAFSDNPASIAVTRRLGYVPDGVDRLLRLGRPAVSQRWRLTAAAFTSPWPVRVEGWSAAQEAAFGLVGATSPDGEVHGA